MRRRFSAQQVKQLHGRKTDIEDSRWLAQDAPHIRHLNRLSLLEATAPE